MPAFPLLLPGRAQNVQNVPPSTFPCVRGKAHEQEGTGVTLLFLHIYLEVFLSLRWIWEISQAILDIPLMPQDQGKTNKAP